MVMDALLDVSWNAAVMTVSPGARAVTRPPVTRATAGADEVQTARAVTSSLRPSVQTAEAVNWELLPTAGVVPVRVMRVTAAGVGSVDVDFPQAAATSASNAAQTATGARRMRGIMTVVRAGG